LFDTKRITAPLTLKAEDDAEGLVSAVFSTFNMVDSDGDVVMPSAFTDGQSVPMVWSHNWAQPIGKGVIKVEPERAVFDGRFFIETSAGRDAYLTVKAMGDLQEYSWGFQVLDAAPGEMNGQPVRFIRRTEVFEVSPVLVGANRDTYTLAVKGHGLSFDDHSERVRVAVTELVTRARTGVDVREKEGRPMTEARRVRVAAIRDGLHGHADELDALLKETEPKPKATAQGDRLRFDHERLRARLHRDLGIPTGVPA
jgi:HK97 family phage prohead protease